MIFRLGRFTNYAVFVVGIILLAAIAFLVYAGIERTRHKKEISTGAEVYAENCASCHGANLKGEPDWQTPKSDGILPAPPHNEDGHTWHHTDRLLVNYVKLGGVRAMEQEGVVGFNSGMPGFEVTLSDAEITAVLDFIKSRWPEEIRKIQRDRTKIEERVNQ